MSDLELSTPMDRFLAEQESVNVVTVADEAARKNPASYTSPLVGQLRVRQADDDESVWLLTGNDVSLDASWIRLGAGDERVSSRMPILRNVAEESGSSRILSSSDNGKTIRCTNAGGCQIVVPLGLPIGFNCSVFAEGSAVEIISDFGLSLNGVVSGKVDLSQGFEPAKIESISSDFVAVYGAVGAVLDEQSAALSAIQSIPGYVAYFDARQADTVLTAGDVTAGVGDTVEKWVSVDDPAVFASNPTSPPKRTATGIEPDGAGQLLTGTGFPGTTDSRTVIGVYQIRSAVAANSNVRLWDGANIVNSHHVFLVPGANPPLVNARGSETAAGSPIAGDNFRATLASRKSSSEMALFNGMTQQWTKVPYAGNRSDTGFNLFSRASEGAVLDNYAELQGFFFFNAVLSDADTELAEEKAALFFADSRAYLDIVVGFGQSNMSGRADTAGVTRFDGVDGSQIKMADSYRGFFSYAFGSSQDIGSDASNSQFGLESELARLIDENSSTLTAIAKSSEGGTSLAVDWNPLNGPNYADAIQRVLLFRHLVRMQGFEPRIKALVWMQGEKDAADSVLTSQASYESLLEALILDFRGHFGADIPVVICQIKITAPGYSGSADIQAAQAAVAANVSGATLIDTSGPQFTLSDGVHFDAAGQIELGAAVYSAIYG